MIPKTVKTKITASKEDQRIWDKQARTLARYDAAFLDSQDSLDLEIANDWVDAANRAAQGAAEFKVDLPAVPEYPR